jgi:hypothetical protein
MPEPTDEVIPSESRMLRVKMLALMEEGLKESEAVLRILPGDADRRIKFSLGVRKGLWPVTERYRHRRGLHVESPECARLCSHKPLRANLFSTMLP